MSKGSVVARFGRMNGITIGQDFLFHGQSAFLWLAGDNASVFFADLRLNLNYERIAASVSSHSKVQACETLFGSRGCDRLR